jgi:predicted  nucleic acid-binding Zn-ribbon protein
MNGDIRDEWRISKIENDLSNVSRVADEVYSLRSMVDSLEHTCRQLSSETNELRNELESCRYTVESLEQALNEQGE